MNYYSLPLYLSPADLQKKIIVGGGGTWNLHNFTTFSCSSSHGPSARHVSAANAVCKSTDIFRNSCLNVTTSTDQFSLSPLVLYYFCCCLYCADSIIGHWLLSSAHK
jgi:hypothetical protein